MGMGLGTGPVPLAWAKLDAKDGAKLGPSWSQVGAKLGGPRGSNFKFLANFLQPANKMSYVGLKKLQKPLVFTVFS